MKKARRPNRHLLRQSAKLKSSRRNGLCSIGVFRLVVFFALILFSLVADFRHMRKLNIDYSTPFDAIYPSVIDRNFSSYYHTLIQQPQQQHNFTSLLLQALNVTTLPYSNSNGYESSDNGKRSAVLAKSKFASKKFPIPISIVVQLSGEMGNNMDKIVFGRSVQLIAKEMYPDMPTKIVLRHQDDGGPKWRRAEKSLKKCFPQFSKQNFGLGNTNEFTTRVEQQAQALGDDKSNLDLMGRPDDDKIRATIDYLYNEAIPAIQNHDESTSRANGNISLPFIMTNSFAMFNHIDKYYDDISHYLRFNETACCDRVPYPDESVFHLRNFQGMHGNAHAKGYYELSPNQTANELFAHLPKGSKVAITSRGYGETVQAYVDQLNGRGLQARSVHSNSGVHDFCFLLKTQKEMAGYSRSSYYRWAAFLAPDIEKAYIYTTKTPVVEKIKPENAKYDSPLVMTSEGINSYVQCDWDNTILKHRMQCQFYGLDSSDDVA